MKDKKNNPKLLLLNLSKTKRIILVGMLALVGFLGFLFYFRRAYLIPFEATMDLKESSLKNQVEAVSKVAKFKKTQAIGAKDSFKNYAQSPQANLLGYKIVFLRDGDVWLNNAGEPTNITGSLKEAKENELIVAGYDDVAVTYSRPKLSDDGRYLAFVSDTRGYKKTEGSSADYFRKSLIVFDLSTNQMIKSMHWNDLRKIDYEWAPKRDNVYYVTQASVNQGIPKINYSSDAYIIGRTYLNNQQDSIYGQFFYDIVEHGGFPGYIRGLFLKENYETFSLSPNYHRYGFHKSEYSSQFLTHSVGTNRCGVGIFNLANNTDYTIKESCGVRHSTFSPVEDRLVYVVDNRLKLLDISPLSVFQDYKNASEQLKALEFNLGLKVDSLVWDQKGSKIYFSVSDPKQTPKTSRNIYGLEVPKTEKVSNIYQLDLENKELKLLKKFDAYGIRLIYAANDKLIFSIMDNPTRYNQYYKYHKGEFNKLTSFPDKFLPNVGLYQLQLDKEGNLNLEKLILNAKEGDVYLKKS